MTPHVRIFPHSQDEFRSRDELTTWLLTAFNAGGSRYLLRSREAVAELPPGSIVLFRFGNDIVGEGVVRAYSRLPAAVTDQTPAGEQRTYEARVDFAPGSTRLFAPPIPVESLQRLIGESHNIRVARTYHIIPEWSVYPQILAAHVGTGGTFVQ
jgi:hypothetical protein